MSRLPEENSVKCSREEVSLNNIYIYLQQNRLACSKDFKQNLLLIKAAGDVTHYQGIEQFQIYLQLFRPTLSIALAFILTCSSMHCVQF